MRTTTLVLSLLFTSTSAVTLEKVRKPALPDPKLLVDIPIQILDDVKGEFERSRDDIT